MTTSSRIHRLRRAVFLAGAIAFAMTPALAHAQQLVLLVRHAERADGGAGTGSMTAPADPPLSAAGEARAAKLAAVLADAGITAIYTTEYKRTKDTAKPLTAKLNLTPRVVAANDTAALVATIRKEQPDGVVLIVGHSNTLPGIIKAFGGSDVKITDQDYDSLFVLVPQTGATTRIRY